MDNLNFLNIYNDIQNDQMNDILNGLKDKKQKKIDSKYFYDDNGSKLFEEITNLVEYYPTKTELEILDNQNKTFRDDLPSSASVIEFGSGSNRKIKKLLNTLQDPQEYIAIDISKEFLFKNARDFARKFPDIKVTAICADFRQVSELKKIIINKKKKIGFFPGSTIGNFNPKDAKALLEKFSLILGKNNYLIIGVDLIKKKEILEKAYNDSKGITAKFNINILNRLNIELGTFFDLDQFEHNAFFNSQEKRVEMHLVSKISQSVEIFDQIIRFKKGETIHTENSYKYPIEEFIKLAENSGFKTEKILTDKKNFFGIFFLKVVAN